IHHLTSRNASLPLTPDSLSPLPRRNNNITLHHDRPHSLKHTLLSDQHHTNHPTSICCLRNSSGPCPTSLNLQYIWPRLHPQLKPTSMLKIIIPTTILLPTT
ncbi:NADH-ubiquinone oxidoreductase chain 4L domain protein, partial [Chlamydia psittaci 09DC77]